MDPRRHCVLARDGGGLVVRFEFQFFIFHAGDLMGKRGICQRPSGRYGPSGRKSYVFGRFLDRMTAKYAKDSKWNTTEQVTSQALLDALAGSRSLMACRC